MIDLSNGNQWLKIYDQFTVAQSIPNQPGRHYPLLPQIIPTILDNYIIAISCKPTVSKPTWKLAAKVYSLIDINNSDIDVAKSNDYHLVSINQTNIIKINRLSTYYRLLVEVVNWFADVHIEIWVYTGIDTLKSTNESLADIETNLIRIESKIDNYSTF